MVLTEHFLELVSRFESFLTQMQDFIFFQHMFFMMNPERSSSEKNKPFVGRLCGFRIHPSAIEIQLVFFSKSLYIIF
jgi:hypothetical protein